MSRSAPTWRSRGADRRAPLHAVVHIALVVLEDGLLHSVNCLPQLCKGLLIYLRYELQQHGVRYMACDMLAPLMQYYAQLLA